MITIGCDIHLKTTTMTVLDNNGKKIKRKRLENHPDKLRDFIHQFPGEKQLSVEASYNWPVFYEQFKDQVDQFHLIHPKRFKAIIDSQNKNDPKDADLIAELTHLNYFPRAYIADAEARQLRRLLRTRVQLSGLIASFKNRIHAIINSNTFYYQRPRGFKNLFCKRGLVYLEALSLPENERFMVDQLLEQIRQIEKLRDNLDEKIQGLDFHSEQLKYLKTVPGMGGKVFKYIVLAEIDNINRFRKARGLIAYAGLIPKDRSSGGKIRRGNLRTDINHYLRWALIESVTAAIKADPALRAYYWQMKKKHHSSAARIATARKLARAIFYVLKEQTPYRSDATFETKPPVRHSVSIASE